MEWPIWGSQLAGTHLDKPLAPARREELGKERRGVGQLCREERKLA